MKHAGPEALARLEPLLGKLRRRTALREKTTGVFYRASRAFLHFHEDPAGLFADVRVGDEWERIAVDAARGRERLLARIDELIAPQSAPPHRSR